MKKLISAGLVLAMTTVAVKADSVRSAYRLCARLDQTGMTSSKCEVSGWNSTVDVVIEMRAAEARDLCRQIAGLMMREESFDDRWQLRIFSPYSRTPIAFCKIGIGAPGQR